VGEVAQANLPALPKKLPNLTPFNSRKQAGAGQIDSTGLQYYKRPLNNDPASRLRMNMSERNYTEKRNFIRMKVDTPVELTISGDNSRVVRAICKDLSGTGMLVEVEETIELGTELVVAITSGKNPFEADAAVTRSRTSSNGRFIIGLKISDIR